MNDWQKHFPNTKPKYLAVEQMIVDMVQQGFLSTNSKLPSERNLAQYLNLNRSTISRAFDDLEANNVIVRKVGNGSFISDYLETEFNTEQVNWHTYLEEQRFQADIVARQQIKNLIDSQSEEVLDVYSSDLPEALMPKFDFPNLSWQDFIDAKKESYDSGYQPLLRVIKNLYKNNTSLRLSTDGMLITGGVKQSLFLILQGLLAPGDAVVTEFPSFFYSSSLFKATGVNVFTAVMDDEGINVNKLELQIRQHKAKLVLLNPNFQNPTGQVMSLKRRKEVILLCRKYSIPIVEDDVFGWLNFGDNVLPTLKELDPENVIYISSLSKIMGENTRVGWLVATPQIIKHLGRIQKELDMTDSIVPQVMAYLVTSDSSFQKQLNTLRKKLKVISEIAYRELKNNFPDWHMKKPEGGYYLWVTNVKVTSLLPKLIEEKLAIAPGIIFGKDENTMRINFARLDSQNLVELIRRLKIIESK